jgi:hypothetical protein
MRPEMILGLLRDPRWPAECRDELAGTGHKLDSVTDPISADITVPPRRHETTVHGSSELAGAPGLCPETCPEPGISEVARANSENPC